MTAWIVAVGKNYPEHLGFAAEDRLWDTKKNAAIRSGDSVFFWLEQSGFRLWARATSDLALLDSFDTAAHWTDRESGVYKFRIRLEPVSKDFLANPKWGQMQAATGITYGANVTPAQIPEGAVEYFEDLFDLPESGQTSQTTRADIIFDPEKYVLGEDLRQRAVTEIKVRRGQGAFRDQLLDAYGESCAITECSVPSVLEAAHIDRYFGENSHHISNGLLLRCDIHTLFDLQWITVDDTMTVRVAPQLVESEYAELEGRRLRPPRNPLAQPDRDALTRHAQSCSWLALG